MFTNENLEAKYGRKKVSNDTSDTKTNEVNDVKEGDNLLKKYSRNKKAEEVTIKREGIEKPEEQKTIEENIKDTLSKYGENIKNNNNVDKVNKNKKVKEESAIVKFVKSVIIILIVVICSSIIIALTMRPQINLEGEQIVEQIKKAENLYFLVQKKYHYFAKTNYDNTLGVDLNKYKYFTFYEVIPSQESSNYEVKLYGATNAFTITYYTVKAFIKNKF
ncbi:MAG: hypothetical protein WCS83_01710 [Endomicrobiia bacterium]|nr:hypothetical protein [Endomicrobiaceae bacterium]MDD3053502.1 hypothetical protein [Endomicrobiaceae bacterium]MDD3922437.1 hypothetical protein [Endomicrobiaceae bacterium]MDD5102028.1 hypothetical protein [Endomicrobiaceae bacterium]